MSKMNLVIQQGNLTDNPKVFGEEDKQVVRFTLAVNNGFGEYKSTTFVDCVVFGKTAQIVKTHCVKGQEVLIRGMLEQARWEDKETGKPRSKLEVKVQEFHFVSGNKQGAETEVITNEEAPVY